MTETNGSKPGELPALSPEEVAAIEQAAAGDPAAAAAISQEKAESLLDATLMQVLGIVIRGIMVSTGGMPPDVIWRSIMRCCARLIGESMAGDLAPVWKARITIREEFLSTLKRMPVKPTPGPPGAQPR